MTGYLLDTNACIDFLLGRSDALAARMGDAFGRLYVSAVTAAELRAGNRSSREPDNDAKRIDVFLAAMVVVPFDAGAAIAYAQMVRLVGMRGGSFDRLIAAHALSLDLTLVTSNERDFTGIPGLTVENWTR